MVKLKLRRVGRRNRPYFRIIVVDARKDPWGDYIEVVGHFDPFRRKETMVLNEERIKYWLSKGAQPTDPVHNILVSYGIIKGPKIPKRIKKTTRKEAKGKVEKKEEGASS